MTTGSRTVVISGQTYAIEGSQVYEVVGGRRTLLGETDARSIIAERDRQVVPQPVASRSEVSQSPPAYQPPPGIQPRPLFTPPQVSTSPSAGATDRAAEAESVRPPEPVSPRTPPAVVTSRPEPSSTLRPPVAKPVAADFANLPTALVRPHNNGQDILRELITFGRAETVTFNPQELDSKWATARGELLRYYDEEVKKLPSGEKPAETKQEFVDRVLPSRQKYVGDVLAAQPTLKRMAADTGIAMVPVYGTIRTWDESSGWMRALSVTSDLLFIVPVAGQIGASGRAGMGFAAAARSIAIAEAKAPFVAFAHPIQTIKGTIAPLEPLLYPRRIPLPAVEVRRVTAKIAAEPLEVTKATIAASGQSAEKITETLAHRIRLPDTTLQQSSPAQIMKARDEISFRAIRGERPVALLPGARVEITRTGLQRVTPAAVHSAPDIRNYLVGATVGEGREKLGLFFAPQAMSKYTRVSSAGGTAALSKEADLAVTAGRLSDKAVPGSIIVTDPVILSQLKESGKLFGGSAEIEARLLPGTKLPAPSQLLYSRNEAGELITLAVIGKPLNPAQIAKLKFIGGQRSVSDMFSRPGRATSVGTEATSANYKQMAKIGTRIQNLLEEARIARLGGNEARAVELERAASKLGRPLDAAVTRASLRSGGKIAYAPIAMYHGTQNIRSGLETMSGERSTKIGGSRRSSAELRDRVEASTRRTSSDTRKDGTVGRRETTPDSNVRRVDTGRTDNGRVDSGRTDGGRRNGDGRKDIGRLDVPGRLDIGRVPSGRIETLPIRPDVPGRVDTGKVLGKPKLGRLDSNRNVIVGGKPVSSKAVIAWRQGIGYWVVPPPYTRSVAFFTIRPPAGVKIARGPKSAFRSLTRLGGGSAKNFELDLGIVDAKVTASKGSPQLRFVRDT